MIWTLLRMNKDRIPPQKSSEHETKRKTANRKTQITRVIYKINEE
jgi:hypothetical protein